MQIYILNCYFKLLPICFYTSVTVWGVSAAVHSALHSPSGHNNSSPYLILDTNSSCWVLIFNILFFFGLMPLRSFWKNHWLYQLSLHIVIISAVHFLQSRAPSLTIWLLTTRHFEHLFWSHLHFSSNFSCLCVLLRKVIYDSLCCFCSLVQSTSLYTISKIWSNFFRFKYVSET